MNRSKKDGIRLAVLISVLWHIMCLSVVNIVVVADPLVPENYSDITFLGPILEKTAFEMMVDTSKLQTKTLYGLSMQTGEDMELAVSPPSRLVRQDIGGFFETEPIFATNSFITEHIKVIPEMTKKIYYNVDRTKKNKDIEGPAKKRELIFRPEKPSIGYFGTPHGEPVELKYKIVLSRDGLVEMVIPITVSEDPDVNVRYSSYVKKWRFSAKQDGKKYVKDWGLVTLKVRV